MLSLNKQIIVQEDNCTVHQKEIKAALEKEAKCYG